MPFERAAAWQQHFDGRDAERVLRGFWKKAGQVAAGLPFAEDLLTAYYCAFDHATPLQVKAALVGALAYFVMPFDLRPDFLPLIGFGDDLYGETAKVRFSHFLRSERKFGGIEELAAQLRHDVEAARRLTG